MLEVQAVKQITAKVLSPAAGVAKLSVGAPGPAAGVDVTNPGGTDPSGRRIESVGNWDSCKVPVSTSCTGHCVSCSSVWLVSWMRSSSCLLIVSSVEAACFTTSERSFRRRSLARWSAFLRNETYIKSNPCSRHGYIGLLYSCLVAQLVEQRSSCPNFKVANTTKIKKSSLLPAISHFQDWANIQGLFRARRRFMVWFQFLDLFLFLWFAIHWPNEIWCYKFF